MPAASRAHTRDSVIVHHQRTGAATRQGFRSLHPTSHPQISCHLLTLIAISVFGNLPNTSSPSTTSPYQKFLNLLSSTPDGYSTKLLIPSLQTKTLHLPPKFHSRRGLVKRQRYSAGWIHGNADSILGAWIVRQQRALLSRRWYDGQVRRDETVKDGGPRRRR